MKIANLSPDNTYDADMIDRKIFIGESYDAEFWIRYFRKKDLQRLYKLFLEQVIPFAKEILKTFFHSNDERLYNELFGHLSTITDPFIQERIQGIVTHRCMSDILEKAYDIYVDVFTTKIGVTFFLEHLECIAELRYEDISYAYNNYANSMTIP
ncbi:7319_t:CDS:2 [Cetraspora pellucida]|uniref:7319_t:CDS:1 n=1 Tax=Cetraspora pellucida TaxID=1433469 RepID=A0ACA9KRK9_9GLOM|nr:7319_t:CDS:2 [Cetraspora pellucida]